MERKINLDEILVQMFKNGKPFYNETDIKNAMREVCRQVLELAAENVNIKSNTGNLNRINIVTSDLERLIAEVNKQEILDTINQIQ